MYALWREHHRRRRRRGRGAPAGRRVRLPRSPPTSTAQVAAAGPRPSRTSATAPAPAGEAGALRGARCARAASGALSVLRRIAARALVAAAARVGARAARGRRATGSGSSSASRRSTFSWVPLRGLGARPAHARGRAAGPADRRPAAARRPAAGRRRGWSCSRCRRWRRADVAELAGLDLGGHALAAPDRPGTGGISGFGVIHAAAARLDAPHAGGRRRCAARRTRATRSTSTRSRTTSSCSTSRGCAAERLRGRGAAAGRGVRAQRPRGAALPHRPRPRDRSRSAGRRCRRGRRARPGLIHWADRVKPWQPRADARARPLAAAGGHARAAGRLTPCRASRCDAACSGRSPSRRTAPPSRCWRRCRAGGAAARGRARCGSCSPTRGAWAGRSGRR